MAASNSNSTDNCTATAMPADAIAGGCTAQRTLSRLSGRFCGSGESQSGTEGRLLAARNDGVAGNAAVRDRGRQRGRRGGNEEEEEEGEGEARKSAGRATSAMAATFPAAA